MIDYILGIVEWEGDGNVDAANVVSFALYLEWWWSVYEILCPFWHSEVLVSFVQFDDPACAYAEPVITNFTILIQPNWFITADLSCFPF